MEVLRSDEVEKRLAAEEAEAKRKLDEKKAADESAAENLRALKQSEDKLMFMLGEAPLVLNCSELRRALDSAQSIVRRSGCSGDRDLMLRAEAHLRSAVERLVKSCPASLASSCPHLLACVLRRALQTGHSPRRHSLHDQRSTS